MIMMSSAKKKHDKFVDQAQESRGVAHLFLKEKASHRQADLGPKSSGNQCTSELNI